MSVKIVREVPLRCESCRVDHLLPDRLTSRTTDFESVYGGANPPPAATLIPPKRRKATHPVGIGKSPAHIRMADLFVPVFQCRENRLKPYPASVQVRARA